MTELTEFRGEFWTGLTGFTGLGKEQEHQGQEGLRITFCHPERRREGDQSSTKNSAEAEVEGPGDHKRKLEKQSDEILRRGDGTLDVLLEAVQVLRLRLG
jgi:hypothetical protein